MIATVVFPLNVLIALLTRSYNSVYEGTAGCACLKRVGTTVGAELVCGRRASERVSVLVTIIDGRVRRPLSPALVFRI